MAFDDLERDIVHTEPSWYHFVTGLRVVPVMEHFVHNLGLLECLVDLEYKVLGSYLVESEVFFEGILQMPLQSCLVDDQVFRDNF